MFRWTVLAGAVALAACNVEPRDFPQPVSDAGTRDATVTVPDAGCDEPGGSVCGALEVCGRDGKCAGNPTTCADSDECIVPGFVCTFIPATPTRLEHNECIIPKGRCTDDSQCGALEVCSARKYCVPELLAFRPNVIACDEAIDCGAGGICRDGFCRACGPGSACPASLECNEDFGFCHEQASCTNDAQCFPGNRCVMGACTRVETQCLLDAANDQQSGAVVIDELLYRDRSICGEDTDWYSIELPQDLSAVFVISSKTSSASLDAQATDSAGNKIRGTASLVFPYMTLIAVPGTPEEKQTVLLEVRGNDISGGYDFEVRRELGLCTGDALDLYGDSTMERAPYVLAGEPLVLASCAGDDDFVKVRVEAGDRITVHATYESARLGLAVFDSMGVQLSAGTSSTAPVTVLATSDIYVRVRGSIAASAGTEYTLTIDRDAGVRFNACRDAVVLSPVNRTAAARLMGGTNVAEPEQCVYFPLRPPRNDAIFEIAPPSNHTVVVATIHPHRSTSAIVAELIPSCEDDTTDYLACDSAVIPNRDLELRYAVTSTAPIYLVVSSDGTVEDVDFDVEVEFEDYSMPANETCVTAPNVTTSTVIHAGTYGAVEDASLPAAGSVCSVGNATGGPDRFYRVPMLANERVALELRGPVGGVLWVSTDCAMLTRTCTTAAAIDGDTPAAVAHLHPRFATNYIVAVDSVEVPGPFELRVVRSPELECFDDRDCSGRYCDDYRCEPRPANDRCPGTTIATSTNARTIIEASTGAASDDYAPTCSPATGRDDVVYNFQIPAGIRSLEARLTQADFDAILMIRNMGTMIDSTRCASSANEVACNDDVVLGEILLPEVVINNPAPGWYALVVDAFEGSGRFTLEVEVRP